MNTKNKIFQALAILCMTVLLWSCKNDDWHAVELDNTPVYELYALKDAETNQPVNISKFSVYRETFDLIVWQNDFQTLWMNKIEFFDESNDQPDQLPEWLEIDLDKEKYLTLKQEKKRLRKLRRSVCLSSWVRRRLIHLPVSDILLLPKMMEL